MFFKGHRDFLSASEKEGEIVRIEKEVDWNLEAGAVTRRSYELKERAPFFQKIKDYPEGYRMSGAPLSNYRRVAVAMGMDADAHPKEIFEEYGRRIKSPVKPVLVQSGSCKENIITGDEINLFKFPAPMVHDGDGGRYLATWHLIVTRDAEDTNWVNWGMYRQMVHNRKIMGGLILPGQDIG
ncbi:MAG: UbiD family decarboxylase, partial [Thermodesulfobacteriota bacterium]|nr:UbiD family decarboxylase [Thermodesulfobacteriota bacterium]